MKHFPETLKFLIAYFLYNDGIQTVIAVASTFAAAPLLQGGLALEQQTLIAVILMIQFVAFFGALFWGRLAGWIGAKQSVIVSLVIWSAVVIYAYGGLRGPTATAQFFVLGIFIALVMGGSQAISRSLFAQMIPNGKEAEFFSFYEISERGTSWIGPLVFGLANQMFGNLRYCHSFVDLLLHYGLDHSALCECEQSHCRRKELRRESVGNIQNKTQRGRYVRVVFV